MFQPGLVPLLLLEYQNADRSSVRLSCPRSSRRSASTTDSPAAARAGGDVTANVTVRYRLVRYRLVRYRLVRYRLVR
jgi:hypothetical protein